MAFLRVQTGVCDPTVLGDKSKWFAHQLDPLPFQVWNACDLDFLRRSLQPASIGGGEQHSNSSDSESEPESPSSDLERSGSTSSSYSSLSDLVNELATAEPQNYGNH